MSQRLQAADEQRESASVQCRADEVQAPAGQLGDRESIVGNDDGHHPDGDVDGKQPAPMADRQNGGTHRWADRRGHGDGEGVDADRLAEHFMRVSKANQRGAHTHDTGRAQALDDSRDTHRQQRR